MSTIARTMSGARMKISAKAQYACLAVIELARSRTDESPRRVRQIADAQGIPPAYLLQILLRLKAAGFVQSARGSDGGYQLARSPAEISIGEIIIAIDGSREPGCNGTSEAAHRLTELLALAHAAEATILRSATVAELAAE